MQVQGVAMVRFGLLVIGAASMLVACGQQMTSLPEGDQASTPGAAANPPTQSALPSGGVVVAADAGQSPAPGANAGTTSVIQPAASSPGSRRTEAAAATCGKRPTIESCVADVEHECFWGPNWASPAGAPCEPPEGICQSILAPSYQPVIDAEDDAACRTRATLPECQADTEHRCYWVWYGIACVPGTGGGMLCPPPEHCATLAQPTCTSSLPTIGPAASPHKGSTLLDPRP